MTLAGETPWLRFWQAEQRTDLTQASFWSLAARAESCVRAATAPGQLALVLGHTRPEAMAMFAGIIAAGRVATWFPPNGPQQDRDSYFTHQRVALARIDPAAIFIFDPALAATIGAIDGTLAARVHVPEITPDAAGAEVCRARFIARAASPETVLVQHSSGTTGIKKAVRVTGNMLTGQASAYWPGLRAHCGGALRVASWLPLYHDMGLMAGFLLPLLAGDTLSITDPFDWIAHPELLFRMIEADESTICWMPNFAFRHLVRLRASLAPRQLASLRRWIDCSEACRLEDAAAFEAAFAPWGVAPGSVLGCYAMAETVFAVTQADPALVRGLAVPAGLLPGADVLAEGARLVEAPAPGARHVLSSGRPVPGMELRVTDGQAVLEDGRYGEIAVRAPFLFDGYKGAEAEAAAFDADGFFRTGDLGTVLDGQLYVLGRAKEVIIVNGKNLFAGDVEAALGGIEGIKPGRAVAFGLENATTGSESLVIVAEQSAGSERPPAALRADVSRAVSEMFLVKPGDVRIVTERWLVKSTSGKISRAENRHKYLESFGRAPAAGSQPR